MDQLSKRVYRAPGNRFMVDVGPLSEMRTAFDTLQKPMFREGEEDVQAADMAAKKLRLLLEAKALNINILDDEAVHKEFEKQFQISKQKIISRRKPATYTEQTISNIPENTLLLVSHGAKTGGLFTDDSIGFTLQNVAKVLGPSSNSVNNMINLACYGGLQSPNDFQSAFPNATNVVQGEPTKPNIISLDRIANKEYFWTNVTPNVWRRTGTNWMQQQNP
jgi:hypothetical protein